MKKTKPKRKAKVIDITERRREVTDLVKFIDAHGGKLAPFRAYGVGPPASPSFPDQTRRAASGSSRAQAVRCTARHGVGSHAVPPTMEWAMPTGKKFARQSRARRP